MSATVRVAHEGQAVTVRQGPDLQTLIVELDHSPCNCLGGECDPGCFCYDKQEKCATGLPVWDPTALCECSGDQCDLGCGWKATTDHDLPIAGEFIFE